MTVNGGGPFAITSFRPLFVEDEPAEFNTAWKPESLRTAYIEISCRLSYLVVRLRSFRRKDVTATMPRDGDLEATDMSEGTSQEIVWIEDFLFGVPLYAEYELPSEAS
jgi:hypothetical protein